jgi:hypothetical protein
MADPRTLPPDHDERKPPGPGPGGFSFIYQPLPSGGQPARFPDAEVQVLPAAFFLDLPQAARPYPCLAYGPSGLMAEAFRAGCVDYLREPWSLDELRARLGRLERLRVGLGARIVTAEGRSLEAGGRRILLGEAEYRAFRLLALNLNTVVPRPALRASKGTDRGRASRAADVLVSSLRRKLASLDADLPGALRSVRGQGYILVGKACG